jgi:hypothetical protein
MVFSSFVLGGVKLIFSSAGFCCAVESLIESFAG